MSKGMDFEVKYLDSETKEIASLKGVDFAGQIDKLKSAIENLLGKMEKFGAYELTDITAKVGIELGVLIFKADGSIEMKWSKPKKL
jgi:hypothetical protein